MVVLVPLVAMVAIPTFAGGPGGVRRGRGRFESRVTDRRLGLLLLVATSAGAVAGGLYATLVDARTLSLVFGIVLIAVAVQTLRPRRPAPADAVSQGSFRSSYVEPVTGEVVTYGAGQVGPGFLISLVAGSLSGLLGIGGASSTCRR